MNKLEAAYKTWMKMRKLQIFNILYLKSILRLSSQQGEKNIVFWQF